MKVDNTILNDFAKNFSPTNYADILIRTQRLVDSVVSQNKLGPILVSWKEFEDLSVKASSDNKGRIYLNLTYVRAVVELNLDSYSDNFVSKLKIAAKSYFKNNLRHNLVTDSLIYTINNRPIECLLSLGNVDEIKYIILINILMHLQHYIQLSSNKFEYKFMLLQDEMLANAYHTESVSHLDALAEVLPIIHNYFQSVKFLDKASKTNLINAYITPQSKPEKTADEILTAYTSKNKLTDKQYADLKNFIVERIKIINHIDEIYFPKKSNSSK